jgi:hypothetical protein
VYIVKKLLFLCLAFFFSFLLISLSNAETNLKIPVEYGKVVYRSNEKSLNQIFIIGIGHRDSLTRFNGNNTPRVQAEIYRIGDWLIHNQGCELLLPEGFFKSKTTKIDKENVNVNVVEGESRCTSLEPKILEERLSDNKIYVNAEMLLKENHPLRLQQIEDKDLYEAVRIDIFKLISCRGSDYSSLKSELDYLQEKRTAAMLQKIPKIVNDQFQQGNIKSRKAIFTIGMSHIYKIITYLNENRIKIYAPPMASKGDENYIDELKLQKENFGVSVIIPKTLFEDRKIMEINELDKMVQSSK